MTAAYHHINEFTLLNPERFVKFLQRHPLAKTEASKTLFDRHILRMESGTLSLIARSAYLSVILEILDYQFLF